jgi:hypothetical protein
MASAVIMAAGTIDMASNGASICLQLCLVSPLGLSSKSSGHFISGSSPK